MSFRVVLGGIFAIGCLSVQPRFYSKTVGAADCKDVACKSKIASFKQSINKKPEPPGREELGRAGWTVLHTFAAYYPDKPTEEEKVLANQFLKGFAHFYPCKECAEGLQNAMEEFPPNLESRENASLWVCKMHNLVNEQLGKPMADCELKTLDERWRG